MKISTQYFGTVEFMPYEHVLPAAEYLEWRTTITRSNDGSEESTAIRVAPRQTLSFSFLVNDESAFNQAYRNAQGLNWAVPVWVEAQLFVGYEGARVVYFPKWPKSDFRSRSLVLLWKSENDWQLVDLQHAGAGWGDAWGKVWGGADDRLIFAEPLSKDWVDALIVPVRVGRVSNARKTNDFYSAFSCTFYSNDLAPREPDVYAQYKGEDVTVEDVLWENDGLNDEFRSRVDVFDNSTGLVAAYTPWKNNRVHRRLRHVIQGLDELYDFKRWLYRRAGRARPFWMPHHVRSLTPVAVSGSTFDVRGYDETRTHIAVKTSATTLLREVVDTSDQGGGITRLTLDEALGVSVNDIKRTSYLGRWRFDADRIEIDYQSAALAESVVPVVEVSP